MTEVGHDILAACRYPLSMTAGQKWPQRPHLKPVIGLLGGIGSGKSTVAGMLVSLGCGVVDADALAQAALDEPAVRRQLRQWWGSRVAPSGSRVDRAAVGRLVFNDVQELARLEGLIHPIVLEGRQTLHRQYQADPAIQAIVEDCPLLLEKGLDSGCDILILIRSSFEDRRLRVMESRGWLAAELAHREKNQLPLDIKTHRAQYIVDNGTGKAECMEQVRHVLSQILQDDNESDA